MQKCFAMGMSKEAVRNDRNKMKTEQKSPLPDDQTVTDEEMMLLEEILAAHRATYSREDVVALSPLNINSVRLVGLAANFHEKNDKESISETDFSEEEVMEDEKELSADDIKLCGNMTEISSRGIIKIVDFAKKIRGFLTLGTTDQITLLKAACLEIMILRLSSRYDMNSDTMVFSGGLSATQQQLESSGFEALASIIFTFARSLHKMDIDEMELATLCCVCLVSGDRTGLESPQDVEAMQEPILEALKHYMKSRRKGKGQEFAKLLTKLVDLRGISLQGAEKVLDLRLEVPGELPPLIVEMLGRTENVSVP